MNPAPSFTSGRSLFDDPLRGPKRISEIRFELEKKLAVCVATGGTNGCPIQPRRIKNPMFRSLVAFGMLLKNWTLKDLTECTGQLEGAASLVLMASMEKPIWGASDYYLLETIERLEQFEQSARGSGVRL